MRITFELSGGFAGTIKGCRIDTATLAADERARVESLVEACGISESFTRHMAGGRDLKQYAISIEHDATVLHIDCDDRCLPESVRPLVGFLASKAAPQRPGGADAAVPAKGPARDDTSADDGRWGRFVGQVVARWDDNGRDMTLVEPFAYVDPHHLQWDAPEGAVVDGASIPRVFWSLIGGPFEGRFRNASVVHDVACDVRTRDWEAVHRMFYEACRCGGVAAAQAKTMYYAVHHFGPRWREEERKKLVAGRPVVVKETIDATPAPPTAAQAEAIARYFTIHDVDADAIPGLTIGAEAAP